MKMERSEFLKACLSISSLAFLSDSLFGHEKVMEKPNVLIIGDSISIGYTPFVQKMLKNKANVFRPMNDSDEFENCEGTAKGIKEIDFWVGNKTWDVIHFNFGLHDIKHINTLTGESSSNANDPLQTDLIHYEFNLRAIINCFKKTGAQLIFATTTPVPKGMLSTLRDPENVIKYNNAAVEIMAKEQIPVNDLYTFSLPVINEIQLKNNVHFTEAGYEFLASQVVKYISVYLKQY